MKRFAVIYSAALLVAGLAACTDKVERTVPTSPTSAVRASVAASSAPVSSGSTVCLSYATKRAAAQAELKHARELVAANGGEGVAVRRAEKAEEQTKKLDAIVADACN